MDNTYIDLNNNLTLEQYNTLAERTLSDKFCVEDESVQAAAATIIENFLEAGRKLDKLKKVLYYGKDAEILGADYVDFLKDTSLSNLTAEQQRLLHGAIGIATESVEILEQVHSHVSSNGTKELDVYNLGEELGDVAWYQAIFLRDLKLDYYKILTTNIKKLAARFGEKFSELKANNRDLDTEREILES